MGTVTSTDWPGVTRPAPMGLQKFTWNPDKDQFEKAWLLKDIDNTDQLVPVISATSNMIYAGTKTGGNYAAALGPTIAARQQHQADQVVFCPGGSVQETGAANFLLIRDGRILTRSLDSSFLHGVTRDSLLTIAPQLGFSVEERVFTVDEMLEWVRNGEAALCGTAAVLSGVGVLVREGGREYKVGSGEVGPNTKRLRKALVSMQRGEIPTPAGWITRV